MALPLFLEHGRWVEKGQEQCWPGTIRTGEIPHNFAALPGMEAAKERASAVLASANPESENELLPTDTGC